MRVGRSPSLRPPTPRPAPDADDPTPDPAGRPVVSPPVVSVTAVSRYDRSGAVNDSGRGRPRRAGAAVVSHRIPGGGRGPTAPRRGRAATEPGEVTASTRMTRN